MNAVDAVKTAYAGAHMWFEGTTADLTADQANHAPGGNAPSIGTLIMHILSDEDGMLSYFLMNKPPLYESEGWAAKLGVPLMLDLPANPDPSWRFDPATVRDYAKAVFAQTDAFLAGLTPDDLDREVDLTAADMGKMPTATFLLTLLLGNTYAHTGEISAIKGMLGAKGYPF
jgi:uncharacterized damage-inducible protein DinB